MNRSKLELEIKKYDKFLFKLSVFAHICEETWIVNTFTYKCQHGNLLLAQILTKELVFY